MCTKCSTCCTICISATTGRMSMHTIPELQTFIRFPVHQNVFFQAEIKLDLNGIFTFSFIDIKNSSNLHRVRQKILLLIDLIVKYSPTFSSFQSFLSFFLWFLQSRWFYYSWWTGFIVRRQGSLHGIIVPIGVAVSVQNNASVGQQIVTANKKN